MPPASLRASQPTATRLEAATSRYFAYFLIAHQQQEQQEKLQLHLELQHHLQHQHQHQPSTAHLSLGARSFARLLATSASESVLCAVAAEI